MIFDRTRAGEMAAFMAGAEAVARQDAALALYEAGGRHLLSDAARSTLRDGIDRGVRSLLGLPAVDLALEAGVRGARRIAGSAGTDLVQVGGARLAKAVTKDSALAATRSVGAGMGRAAGAALVIDGAIGAFEAVRRYRRGELGAVRAIGHVCRCAAKGAVASAAGVGLGAAAVALTGGLAAPVVFGVGFLGTLGVRAGLDAVA